MSDKYLKNDGGQIAEQEATATSAGAGSAGKIVALNSSGLIDDTMLASADATSIEAGETLAGGDLVNLYDDSGVKMRKADATDATKPAHGFVLAAVTSGQSGTVYFDGIDDQVSGLTVGATYYLDTATPGGVTATSPSTSGNISQEVGFAKSATELVFERNRPIAIA